MTESITEGDYVTIRYRWQQSEPSSISYSGYVFNLDYGIGEGPMALVTHEGHIKVFDFEDVIDQIRRVDVPRDPCPYYPAPCDHANGHRNPNLK